MYIIILILIRIWGDFVLYILIKYLFYYEILRV